MDEVAMQMFLKPLAELAEYSEIRDRMVRGRGIISLTGCIDAHKAHMIYGLSFDAKKVLVITENDMTARVLHGDLSFYYPEAALYPAKDLLFYQADIASNLLDIQRLRAFRALTGEKQAVVVLPASALIVTIALWLHSAPPPPSVFPPSPSFQQVVDNLPLA